LPDLEVAPPLQFDGPGGVWSPEELFMASLSNCFVLSFRAIAKMSKLQWLTIQAETEGDLDKAEGKIKFTKIRTTARLVIPASESVEKAQRLLQKAEDACFVSNSVNSEKFFHAEVVVQE